MPGLEAYVRVFTAVELAGDTRRALAQDAGLLLDGLGPASRVPEPNFHVTLKFVGEVHREDLPGLHAAVAACCADLEPGEIEVEGLGAFPSLARPRVIWAGVSDPSGILTPVHRRLDTALAAFGAKREPKKYVPHVTVARVRGPFDGAELERRIAREEDLWFGTERVRSVALLMSELDRGGPPRYTALGHYPSR